MNQPSNMTESRPKFTLRNKIARTTWRITSLLVFRPLPARCFRRWRILVLKVFGAKISWTCTIHSSVKIWAPWNLKVGQFSCLGPEVDCYNQGGITVGDNVTISQKTSLCASSHDYRLPDHPLTLNPIHVGDRAWIAAEAFIGPNVSVGDGAVVGARAAVFSDVEAWTVVGGNPAKPIKKRERVC